MGIVRSVFAGLVFTPADACKFSQSSLIFKPIDIPDFSNDTGSINKAGPLNRSKRVGNGFHLLFNGHVSNLVSRKELLNNGRGSGTEFVREDILVSQRREIQEQVV